MRGQILPSAQARLIHVQRVLRENLREHAMQTPGHRAEGRQPLRPGGSLLLHVRGRCQRGPEQPREAHQGGGGPQNQRFGCARRAPNI